MKRSGIGVFRLILRYFEQQLFKKNQHIRWLLLSETKLRKIIDVFIYLFVYLFICLFTYLPIYFTLTIYNESIM